MTVEGRRVLIARCENYREDLDQPCTGRLRYRWGQIEAACDTCGGFCGVAVADWVEVVSGRAGGGEQQDDPRQSSGPGPGVHRELLAPPCAPTAVGCQHESYPCTCHLRVEVAGPCPVHDEQRQRARALAAVRDMAFDWYCPHRYWLRRRDCVECVAEVALDAIFSGPIEG